MWQTRNLSLFGICGQFCWKDARAPTAVTTPMFLISGGESGRRFLAQLIVSSSWDSTFRRTACARELLKRMRIGSVSPTWRRSVLTDGIISSWLTSSQPKCSTMERWLEMLRENPHDVKGKMNWLLDHGNLEWTDWSHDKRFEEVAHVFPNDRGIWKFCHQSTVEDIAEIFKRIADETRHSGACRAITITPFDLFHGHVFVCVEERLVGMLLHGAEYPRLNPFFSIHLGSAQRASNLELSSSIDMGMRNIVHLFEPRITCVLNTHLSSPWRDLVMEDLSCIHTTFEGDFGIPLCDIIFIRTNRDEGHAFLEPRI